MITLHCPDQPGADDVVTLLLLQIHLLLINLLAMVYFTCNACGEQVSLVTCHPAAPAFMLHWSPALLQNLPDVDLCHQVKKPMVEKHYQQKCRNCNSLTCIDCLKVNIWS